MAESATLAALPSRRLLALPLQRAWRRFCKLVVLVHYRRCEIDGLEHVPRSGAVVLCANHPSALIDALIVQAALPRIVHPLARSGLFRNPLLWPILATIRAVPVYRRQDAGADMARNRDMFDKCYEMLAAGGVILIFPEGVSHNDPKMRTVKTGAARLILGALARGVTPLTVLPVGLNFSDIGRFRNNVFIRIGAPLAVEPAPATRGVRQEEPVLALTGRIGEALRQATLNFETWSDQDMLRRLERFFTLRRGKYQKRNLSQRFRALQTFGSRLNQLRAQHPERVAWADRSLRQFERLCRRFGVRDYQLGMATDPVTIARFVARSLLMLLVGFPLGVWGALNSAVPYALTGLLAVRFSKDRYQYDTAKISLGMLFFGLFWGGQTLCVWSAWGPRAGLFYLLSLPPTAGVALFMRRERARIVDNTRVFFLFVRKKKVKDILRGKRTELERNLAGLAKLAKPHPRRGHAADNP
ncbi:MAG: 1-acyl-sn-glycerol-3-phosphate acyltransferase [Candidatus Lambdaproteobacteria bacterium]|nr:1-acyl-sn-glycerol-3-phosphate acyltransferase [Candidatus Lambdaproteobacteria bacterium]